jgi:glucosylceramidase
MNLRFGTDKLISENRTFNYYNLNLYFMKSIKFLLILLSIFFYSCSNRVDWVSTTETQVWVSKSDKVKLVNESSGNSVEIVTDKTFQTIEGFGACFNELGWTSLQKLSAEDQATIMQELFEPGYGANFTITRKPVAANDFSREWYSYSETENDFEMTGFSIANDYETLIPFIRKANEFNPGLKIWASPWSPPAWMKWNKHYACAVPWEGLAEQFHNQLPPERQGAEGANMIITEDAYLKAYALYFARYIEAYRAEGINISMIMPQNEFNSCQIFPSCTWTSAALANFIGEYLGPAMDRLNVEIYFGTMERPSEALVDAILHDPKASAYIKGLGFQWAGKDALPGLNKRYPELKKYQTEQECGDGKNDWKHFEHAWSLMKHYLNNGTNAYLYWNISLEEGGYSRWGWQQNSLVTVDPDNGTYRFNHEYYLMKHFSHFVKPGAVRVDTRGGFNNILAFKNTDRSIVAVLYNDLDEAKSVFLKVGGRTLEATLEARSINTVVL